MKSSTQSLAAALLALGEFGLATAQVQYAGVNIPGFEFGSATICSVSGGGSASPPVSGLGGVDGVGQMNHFVHDDGLNAFRLQITWQYLTNNNFNNPMDQTQFGNYNQLMQGCLNAVGSTGLCIIDFHNFARWENGVIGQDSGAPTAQQFASIWGELAGNYANNPNVAFGMINEPHDGGCNSDVDITTWQSTLQGAVNAIRSAGATQNYILLPGLQYCHPPTYSAPDASGNGDSGTQILAITDNGSTDNSKLLIDVHAYLDYDGSGQNEDCVTNNIDDSSSGAGLSSLATWLRNNGRKAFLSETGGANNDGCVQYLQQELGFLNNNTDVFVGYAGWAAGGILTPANGGVVTLTPTDNGGGSFTDVQLLTQAIQQCFQNPSSCAA